MIRRTMALIVALAVQTAATAAPYVHAHLDDHATDHHGGARAIHSHFAEHHHHHERQLPPAHGPSVEDPDDETAVVFPLFVAVGSQSFSLAPFTVTFADLPAPLEASAHRSLHVVHGHDPPFIQSLTSRAPPAFLS